MLLSLMDIRPEGRTVNTHESSLFTGMRGRGSPKLDLRFTEFSEEMNAPLQDYVQHETRGEF